MKIRQIRNATLLIKYVDEHGEEINYLNPDHIDIAADGTLGAYLDKDIPIIVPTEEIGLKFRADGFKKIYIMSDEFFRYGRSHVEIKPTPALHGTLKPCSEALGLLDNVAHASIDRERMRKLLAKRGIGRYHMPEDGETLEF